MAVVSEPPWINKTSGISARNGTTTHTIPLGFTSTAGNFLMFIVGGAVTHTNAGWTERLSPVSSGELSVFTKTSAGETTFVDTVNGSNYPVAWTAYEFPAGTAWTGGIGANPTSDTLTQLTGLPGTAQVCFGVLARNDGSTGSSYSAVWPGPWVEDSDQWTVKATTDGISMTVAHQINVTATSITPTVTPTYGGTWGITDRQTVTFALDVAAGGPAADPPSPARLIAPGVFQGPGDRLPPPWVGVTPNPSITSLTDPFDTVDADWTPNAGGTAPFITAGQLHLACTSTYSTLTGSGQRYRLTGTAARVEAVQTPLVGNGSTQAYFLLQSSRIPKTCVQISTGAGSTLNAEKVTSGGAPVNIGGVTYDAAAHRWWRIRESAGVVFFEAGPDGLTWPTTIGSATVASIAGFDPEQVFPELGCGYWSAETTPRDAIFDNLNLPPAATVATNTLEGGSNGTTLTTANTGGASGDAFDVIQRQAAATVAFDSTFAAHGGLSCKMQVAGTAGAGAAVQWTTALGGSRNVLYARFYFYAQANPANAKRLLTFATTGGAAAVVAVYLNATGVLELDDSVGGVVGTTVNSIALNAWNRIEVYGIGSATAGHMELRLFKGADLESTTPTEQLVSSYTVNTAGAIAILEFGSQFGVKVTTGPFWYDDVAFSTVDWVGPYVAPGAITYTCTGGAAGATAGSGSRTVTAAGGPPTVVQQNATNVGTAGTSHAISLDAASTPGNSLIVAIGTSGGATTNITAVTDNGGNTWVEAMDLGVSGVTNSQMAVWYCVGAPNAATTITATSSTSQTSQLIVAEVSNLTAGTPSVQTVAEAANTTTKTTPTLTPAGGNYFVAGVAMTGGTLDPALSGSTYAALETPPAQGNLHLRGAWRTPGTAVAEAVTWTGATSTRSTLTTLAWAPGALGPTTYTRTGGGASAVAGSGSRTVTGPTGTTGLTYVEDVNATAGTTSAVVGAFVGTPADGDLAYVFVVNKPSSVTPSAPGGWAQLDSVVVGTGTDGAGTGPVRITVFWQTISGTYSPPTITNSGTGAALAAGSLLLRPNADTAVSHTTTSAQDTVDDATWSLTGAADLGIQTDDMVLTVDGWSNNISGAASAGTLTGSGITAGTVTELTDSQLSSGNRGQLVANLFRAITGTSAGAQTHGETLNAGMTNRTGGTLFVRIRAQGAAVTAVPRTGGGAGAGAGSGSRTVAKPPGSVFTLTNWKLTVPYDSAAPHPDADEILQPALDTFQHAQWFYLDGSGRLVLAAPAVGDTTSGSTSTRSELREMDGAVESAWPAAGGARQLTVTGYWDPTAISGGTTPLKVMIIGQIHATGGTPPVYLTIDYDAVPSRMRLFINGPGVGNLLTSISPTDLMTYRIENTGSWLNVYACLGTAANLPATPQYSYPASSFTESTGWYLKAGAYGKTDVASGSTGDIVATLTYLNLNQAYAATVLRGGGAAGGGAGSGSRTVVPPTTRLRTGGGVGGSAGSGSRTVQAATTWTRTGGGVSARAGSASRTVTPAITYSRTGGPAAATAGSGSRAFIFARAGGGASARAGSGSRTLTPAITYSRTGGPAGATAGSGSRTLTPATVWTRTGGPAATLAGSGSRILTPAIIYTRSGGATGTTAGSGNRALAWARAGGGASARAGSGSRTLTPAITYSRTGGPATATAGSGSRTVQAATTWTRSGGAAGATGGSGSVTRTPAATYTRSGGATASTAGSGSRTLTPAAVALRTGGGASARAGSGSVTVAHPATPTRSGGAASATAASGSAQRTSVRTGGAVAATVGSGSRTLTPATVYLRTGGAASAGAGSGSQTVAHPATPARSGGAATAGAGSGSVLRVSPTTRLRTGGPAGGTAGSGSITRTPATTYTRNGGATGTTAGAGSQTVAHPATLLRTGGASGATVGGGTRLRERTFTGGVAATTAGGGTRLRERTFTGGAAAATAGSGNRVLTVHATPLRTGGPAGTAAASGSVTVAHPATPTRTGGATASTAASGSVARTAAIVYLRTGGGAAATAGSGSQQRSSAIGVLRTGGATGTTAGSGSQTVAHPATVLRTGGATGTTAAAGSLARTYTRGGGGASARAGSGSITRTAALTHTRSGGAATAGAASSPRVVALAGAVARTGGAVGATVASGTRTVTVHVENARTGGGVSARAGSGTRTVTPATTYQRSGGAATAGAASSPRVVLVRGTIDQHGGGVAATAGSGSRTVTPATLYTRSGGAAGTTAGSGARLVVPPTTRLRTGGGVSARAGSGTRTVTTPGAIVRTGGAVSARAASGSLTLVPPSTRARSGGAVGAGAGTGHVLVVSAGALARTGGATGRTAGSGSRVRTPAAVLARSGGATCARVASGSRVVLAHVVHQRGGGAVATVAASGRVRAGPRPRGRGEQFHVLATSF